MIAWDIHRPSSTTRLPELVRQPPPCSACAVKRVRFSPLQHLHGVDRGEAVRYMLEGAAAKSEIGTRCDVARKALLAVQVTGR